MNILIKELADQAKKSVPHGLTPDKWIEVYNEKFAELIVRECAAMTRNLCPHGELAEKAVKQHFGV